MSNKPFKIVATAIALSPNLEANIFESVRITQMLGERLLLIHVGERTTEIEEQLQSILKSCGGEKDILDLLWKTGDPATAILEVCGERKVDLIIAGAIPREGLLRYYMGSVARRLVRGASCSILLMTHPNKLKTQCRRIVVNGLDHPKTPYTIQMAKRVAQGLGADVLTVIVEVEPSRLGPRVEDDESLQKAEQAQAAIESSECSRIDDILKPLQPVGKLKISQKCIFGRRGYTIGHFAETSGADLLVMNSPDTKLGFLDRVFTHDLEYILSELPSDILIVHSHKNLSS